MHRLLLLGAGKIGRMIARFLTDSGDYTVCVGDLHKESLSRVRDSLQLKTIEIDATDPQQLAAAMSEQQTVVSALSFRFNPLIAQVAAQQGLSYFDLTEDVETTRQVRAAADKAAGDVIFMPQCGLAPGFISIVAHQLTKEFDEVDSVFMRVGALPQFPTGSLKYNLTWSTDGLINEYCNPCEVIHEGQRREVLPLEGLESFSLDGVRYEAFNTSGGLGTLCESLAGQLRELNYKTVRYQGHRDYMSFILHELHLGKRRDLLKEILESSVPITFQDVVVTFCTVKGQRNGQLVQISDARKIYQHTVGGEQWSAIQLTTAAALCTVVDMHVAGQLPSKGFVRQEQVDLNAFLANRFGKWYESRIATRFSDGSSSAL